MKFTIKKRSKNIIDLIRSFGYVHHGVNREKHSFVRRISMADYPRFHLYVYPIDSIREKEDRIILNLHLDQKKPSYKGSPAHGGEYGGEILEKEKERIKKLAR